MGRNYRKINRLKQRQGSNEQQQLLSQSDLLAVLIIISACIVLTAHWPVLSARAFSFDDYQYVINNQLVQHPGISSVSRFFTEVLKPSTVSGYYQPLSMTSLMLDYSMGGRVDNVRVFHQTSLALHVVNTVLIIVFLYLLFGQPWVAAIAGLLFGVHPMTVEPVAWIGERKTLLSAFFVLISLIFYVLYTRKSSRKSYRTSLAMFVLALLSKPDSTPLPVLMLLLDYWPLKRLNLKAVSEKAPFFIIAVISSGITFLSQKNAGVVALPQDFPPAQIPLVLCHNIIFYLYKIIWPVNLSSHYMFPDPIALSQPMVLAGVIGTCILIPVLLLSLRRTRALMTGWLFFFTAIFPAMGVIGFTNVIAADRFAYIPSIGLLLPFAWYLNRLWNKLPMIWGHAAASRWGRMAAASRWGRAAAGKIGLLAIVLILAVSETAATRNYLVYWKDTGTYFSHMLSLTPQSFVLHNDFGLILDGMGKYDEAVNHYKEALRINPKSRILHNKIGLILYGQGKLDEAIYHYKEELKLDPGSATVHNNLGLALYKQGKADEAVSRFKEAIRLEPDNKDAHSNLGAALAFRKNYDEAASQYREAIRITPDSAAAYNNLGAVLMDDGKLDEAAAAFRKSLDIDPLNPEIHNSLGEVLDRQKKYDEAIKEYKEALKVNPDFTEARDSLNADIEKQGK